eukprot:94692-Rhodomonas_salina.1
MPGTGRGWRGTARGYAATLSEAMLLRYAPTPFFLLPSAHTDSRPPPPASTPPRPLPPLGPPSSLPL